MMPKWFKIGLLCSLVFTLCCKKEKESDENFTQVTWSIESPEIGSYYRIGDTITILGKVIAESVIDKIEVRLFTESNQVASPEVVIYPQSTSHDIATSVIVEGYNDYSGKHYLRISATTSSGTNYSFTDLNVGAKDVAISDIYYAKSVGELINIYHYPNQVPLYSYKGSMGDFRVNPTNNLLQFVNSEAAEFESVDPVTGQEAWTKSMKNIGGELIPGSIHFSGATVFLADNSGKIQGFNQNGQGNFSGQAITEYLPEQLTIVGSAYFASIQRNQFANKYKIQTLYYPSGQEYTQRNLDSEVYGIVSLWSNQLLIADRYQSKTRFRVYNCDEDFFEFQTVELDSEVLDLKKGIYNQVFVLTENKVYSIDLQSFLIKEIFNSGSSITQFVYDRANHLLILSRNDDVIGIDAASGNLINLPFQIEAPIAGLAFQYTN